jgi:hypothetical protein
VLLRFVFATRFLFEAITLFSREYLLRQREAAKNSGFNKSMGDSIGVCGANPEFLATAKPGGILFEISPFEKAHGLILNITKVAERL